MAQRYDVTVDYSVSPRVITVAAPSNEIIQQDIVDTLRVEEAAFAGGLAFEKLINASGKDDLGGGIFVGITVSLQNALLEFESRRTPECSGTVTTASGTIVKDRYIFEDSSATFIDDGVQRGATIINFTDQSVGDVFEVISQTQLSVKTLQNGFDNTFQVGDEYKIYNIEQMIVRGGNLVAVDENGDPFFSPILPSAFTQVILTSSSSATLQEQSDIQYASFNGGVTIDTTNGVPGTTYPIGTPRQPVNNLTDALIIATSRGLYKIFIQGNITLTGVLLFDGFEFVGEGQKLTTITIDPSITLIDCAFTEASITGTVAGPNNAHYHNCDIFNLNGFYGLMENCILSGTIVLAGTGHAQFSHCESGIPGGTFTPVIDFNGSGTSVSVRGYNGGLKIQNRSGTDAVSIDVNSGQVIIDPTVIAGTITVRGVAKLIDNSTGTAVIVNELLESIKLQQIHGGVPRYIFIDPASPNGTGYQQDPFSNFADAADFAAEFGIKRLVVMGDITLDRTMNGYEFYGVGTPVINIGGHNVNNSEFHDVELSGSIQGRIHAHDCDLADNITGVNGEFTNCGLGGDITLANSARVIMDKCFSVIGGLGRPTITLGSGNSNISVRSYSGGLTMLGVDHAGDEVTLEISQGKVTLDSTCTNGVISVRGIAQLTDNSNGSIVDITALIQPTGVNSIQSRVWEEVATSHISANTMGLLQNQIKANTDAISLNVLEVLAIVELLQKFAKNRTLVDPINKTLTVYQDNGTTPLHVFDLKDFTGSPSVDTIAERIPQ